MEFKTQLFGYNRQQVDEQNRRTDMIFLTQKKDLDYLKAQNEGLKLENQKLLKKIERIEQENKKPKKEEFDEERT